MKLIASRFERLFYSPFTNTWYMQMFIGEHFYQLVVDETFSHKLINTEHLELRIDSGGMSIFEPLINK